MSEYTDKHLTTLKILIIGESYVGKSRYVFWTLNICFS